ncbi:phospholipid-binding protein MlaC [Alteromonas macleodii]|uniref:MlaC/ttg2D family ABC transporter substrate-binding protein n=1 Tax=Alteromonas macleodii TaxID=28108 RepID=UPI003660A9A4
MFRIITAILTLLLSSVLANSHASELVLDNPYEMVQQVANQTFSRIKNQKSEIEQNPLILDEIVMQELLPHIDYNFAAFKVLGKYFKDYSKEELNLYLEAFKDYSVDVVSNALKYYKDQDVVFEPRKDIKNEKFATVRIQIIENGNTTNLTFQVRKNTILKRWLVYDISAEGVSMVSSLQSQFAPILRKEGLAAVVKEMSK